MKICKVETYCHVHFFNILEIGPSIKTFGFDPKEIGLTPVSPAMGIGVIGNTNDSESLKSRFEP